MYQLTFHEVFPPRGGEGAIALLFQGPEPRQNIIIGIQGTLAEHWKRPIAIQLPSWCSTIQPNEGSISEGIYKWTVKPAEEPYTLLWPENLERAEYNIGDLPLKLYFGEEPPLLRGIFNKTKS